jgi:hypothetical protein
MKATVEHSYPAFVPDGVGSVVGCYAAAPGFGSSMGGSGLFISNDATTRSGDSTADMVGRAFAFYKSELGSGYRWVVSSHGYFEYRSFLEAAKAAWTKKPSQFETGRYELFTGTAKGSPAFVLTVATRATVQSEGSPVVRLNQITQETKFAPTMTSGHLFAGAHGSFSKIVTSGTAPPKITITSAAGPTTECAVFLDTTATLYALVRKGGTKAWALAGTIPHEDENGKALADVTDGVLHRGSPKKVWF